MAPKLNENNPQISVLNERADRASVGHHGPSSMHQAVVLFLGSGRDTSYISACSASLYRRPPPPAVQVNCQHDLWRRELSPDRLLNLPPDELVPSAHVTVVCFPHRPIFIHANKLNLPCFRGSCFFPPSSFSSYVTCSTITADVWLTPRGELHRAVCHVSFSPSSSSDMSNIQIFNRSIVS